MREWASLLPLECGAEMTMDAGVLILLLGIVAAVISRRRPADMGRVSDSWMRRMKHERQDDGQ